MKNVFPWKIFFILFAGSLISIMAVFPYVLTVQSDVIRQIPVPISTLVLAQMIQSIILFFIVIFFGLKLSKSIGFHLPILELITTELPYRQMLTRFISQSTPIGILIALSIYAVDYGFSFVETTISTGRRMAPVWQTLLAAIYGGLTEELIMRLFLMSLFIWIINKITRTTQASHGAIYISILLAAVIFGLGHLPITASLTTITPLIVIRAVVLNGIGGVTFGWLYWKRGLEASIIAHFTADIVLLTILPSILPY